MSINLKGWYDAIHSKDIFTWIGHGALGFLFMVVFGIWGVIAAFLYREISDLLSWWRDPRPAAENMKQYKDTGGAYKRPFGDKLKDGFFDFWSPMAGAAIAAILFGL